METPVYYLVLIVGGFFAGRAVQRARIWPRLIEWVGWRTVVTMYLVFLCMSLATDIFWSHWRPALPLPAHLAAAYAATVFGGWRALKRRDRRGM